MHKYFLKIPWWIRRVYPSYLWKMPADGKRIYLTFDDGPHPTITPWVLGELEKYNAKATFFCIGQNVERHREVYERVLAGGHSTGNHTFSHLNGWQTPDNEYLIDVEKANPLIESNLFRPPYGRIRRTQAKGLGGAMKKENVKVVMWDVLSADFDASITPETCAGIVLQHREPGSIVVFHDSEKALANLSYALPMVLEKLSSEGYSFERL